MARIMSLHFSSEANRLMRRAANEAERFRHEYIGTEHILLGLVKEDSGSASVALKAINLDPRRIRVEVEQIMQHGPDFVTAPRLAHTPPAKRVFDYAREEARDSNLEEVGTGHLLIALVRETEGVAGTVLANLGVSLDVVRREVERAAKPDDADADG